MDKNTLSNYGWIVIAVLVLAVMIALATPFGKYIESGVRSTTAGLFDTSEKAMNVVGMSAGDGNFEDTDIVGGVDNNTREYGTNDVTLNHKGIIPEGGTYITGRTYYDGGRYDESHWISTNTITYVGGQAFPELQDGDVYIYEDFIYVYNSTMGDREPYTYPFDYNAKYANINGWTVLSRELVNENDDFQNPPCMSMDYNGLSDIHNAYILESINNKDVTDTGLLFYNICIHSLDQLPHHPTIFNGSPMGAQMCNHDMVNLQYGECEKCLLYKEEWKCKHTNGYEELFGNKYCLDCGISM